MGGHNRPVRYTFRQWRQECECGWAGLILAWDYDPKPCPRCGAQTSRQVTHNLAPSVIGDDIPGGIVMEHGVCYEDGSPRTFYSKSEIRQVARAKGLVRVGETPGKTPGDRWV
jgi:hypothetical protein